MPREKLFTLQEVAEKLRVSKHTVQAWISPSSPNHRPEFAILARHAGRKTVFVETDIEAWLNQRRGAVYSDSFSERSAYWREKFIAGRGLLKGYVKAPEIDRAEKAAGFSGGLLAFDAEPILSWLSDGAVAPEILAMAGRAEGLVLAVPLAFWLLRRAMRTPSRYQAVNDFLLGQNIFELAPMNEEVLRRALELPQTAGELSLQSYCCCLVAGASVFMTGNKTLLKLPGLSVSSF